MAEAEVTEPSVSLVFDPSQKKKKKKKKVVDEVDEETVTEGVQNLDLEENASKQTENDEQVNNGENEGEDGGDEGGEGDTAKADGVLDLQMNFGKKKKKKKKPGKVQFGETEDLMAKKEDTGMDGTGEVVGSGLPWDGSDRDYTYHELIQRAFQILHSKNAGHELKKTFKSRPPSVKKEGKKKTIIVNFTDICKGYRRQPDHLLAYLSAELGTTGSMQSNGSLVIKGNFDEAGIENVLKRYIKEYVACGSCHSPDTVLIRDASTRLYFLQCETCGASRSVANIQQGYMAQIGKRKH